MKKPQSKRKKPLPKPAAASQYNRFTHEQFVSSLRKCFGIIIGVIAFSLAIGMCGYHYLEDLEWIDAFHNAGQILGGMGEVNDIKTFGGKLFSGLYAIYCGLVLLASMGLLFAPIMHRVMHVFHIHDEEDEGVEEEKAK